MSDFVLDIWYFAGLSTDLRKGQMHRIMIAGEPINLGRDKAGRLNAPIMVGASGLKTGRAARYLHSATGRI